MKPAESTIDVQSNITGREIDLTVDASSMGHLMRILTDLYSDPIKAIVREYSTNALDSHREAGVNAPIIVELPSYMSPVFKVKDFGVGLSQDEIVEVYSKYGASTKRETNEQTGMLGLGCKSALSYTSQFTIVGRKDGREVMVSASRNDQGAGTMTLVADRETDQGNGVEITVPVSTNDVSLFEAAAKDFFCTWEPEQVTVIGAEIPFVSDSKNYWMSEDVVVVPFNVGKYSYRRPQVYIVQGGVAYPVEYQRWDFLPKNADVFVYMDIGSIDFTPSREELHYTPRTVAAVTEAARKFKDARYDWVKQAYKNASSRDELLKAHYAASALSISLPVNEETKAIKYKGRSILPSRYAYKRGEHFVRPVKGDKHHEYTGSLSEILDAVWVTGFTNKNYVTSQHNKIKHYLEEQGIEVKYINVVDKLPKEHLGTWEKEIIQVEWKDIPPAPRQTLSGGLTLPRTVRQAGTYVVLDTESGTENILAADVLLDRYFKNEDEPVVVFVGPKYDLDCVTHAYKAEAAARYVVQVPPSKFERFKRECDEREIVHFKEAYATWVDDELKEALDSGYAEHIALEQSYYALYNLPYVPSSVQDGNLRKWIKLAEDHRLDTRSHAGHYRTLLDRQTGADKLRERIRVAKQEISDLTDKYPLLQSNVLSNNEYFPDNHRVIYFDAIHEKATKED